MLKTAARALLLALPLYAAPLVFFPETTPVAEAKAKSKAKRAKKVTAASIVRWAKRGESDDDIVAKAEAAGYVASKRDAKIFKMKRLPPSLIAALGAGPEPVAFVPKKAEKVELTKAAKVSDIDFDDVDAPAGTPEKKKAAVVEDIDRSLRPSAPFEEPKSNEDASQVPRRKPLIPKD